MTISNPSIDFPVSIGCRIRLTAEQKNLIKEAFNAKLNQEMPVQDHTHGGVSVVTKTSTPNLTMAMGCDRFTLSSLLATSERFNVGMLQKWEKALDISLVTKKDLETAWKSYVKHVFG